MDRGRRPRPVARPSLTGAGTRMLYSLFPARGRVAELADAEDSKSSAVHSACGFDSLHGHHFISSSLGSLQVAEGTAGYIGSIEGCTVEREPLRKEERLQALLLFERAWIQVLAALGRRRSAKARMPSTSSFELRGVTIYPREREFLAQFIAVALVTLGVNGLLEDVGMLELLNAGIHKRLLDTLHGGGVERLFSFPSLSPTVVLRTPASHPHTTTRCSRDTYRNTPTATS